MLQVHTTGKLEQAASGLRLSAERHGGSVLAVTHAGHLLGSEPGLGGADAVTFTLCFADLYAPLLRADIRFAALLPSRVAVWTKGESVFLEALSPRDCCGLLHRPEMEPLAVALEDRLRVVMEEAAHRPAGAGAGGHRATEELVNMRAALPQRIDCQGTKVEELAGTGTHDAPGG